MQLKTTKKDLDELSYKILGAAIEVHKALVPDFWKASITNV